MDQVSAEYKAHDLKRGVDYIGVCCVFYCHDGNGNLLMAKRSAKCRDEQGKWDVGGGSMEFGETFEDTVRREIREEYGVEPERLQQVPEATASVVRDNNGTKTHWIAFRFVAKVPREDVKIGEPESMDEIGWFPFDQLPDNLHPALLPGFLMVREHMV